MISVDHITVKMPLSMSLDYFTMFGDGASETLTLVLRAVLAVTPNLRAESSGQF